ncbi:hypothetical protein ACFWOY_19610 [Streptomyces sp. NPDC058423]|uniref:hypothetical protein n=1 Tax=unclassified Streptomyces TaxID=2593676 RepID=UPI00365911E6
MTKEQAEETVQEEVESSHLSGQAEQLQGRHSRPDGRRLAQADRTGRTVVATEAHPFWISELQE